ncbi:hypothetical protein EST38_g4159 [Candolleomyces aberdarensis]|uniref:LCCL domain-containing protein n=1 Tax=Candolleomyces aberdarensis TaxID=2316362 RepID=A0A4Q2DNS6_9AGAR|nr:hypothetical protein EST38_g4159 [Candolleomyces aberdarensis]
MALPAHITTKNLSGRFTMNKELTPAEPLDKILGLQGIGWLKRKAIAIGTITLTFKHYKDDGGVEHFDIDNHLTGGIPGSREERPVDGAERKRSDMHFGPQLFYTKRRTPGDKQGLSEFSSKGWTEDTLEDGLIETQIRADTKGAGWRELHTWGIQEINGERRFVRNIDFEGPKKEHIQIVMYFDYLGA